MQAKPTIEIDDFVKLDLRVATIIQAEPHPNADKLLRLQVDVGEGEEGGREGGQEGGEGGRRRQICAGLREFVDDPSTLVGRQIVIVANLKPRKMRGEISEGMLLAASIKDADGTYRDVITIGPTGEVPPGTAVS